MMNKMLKLTAIEGKVYVNINTLRTYNNTIFINPAFEKDWIQINKKDVRAFIANQKAQKESKVNPVETTEVKTE